MPSNLFN